MKGVRTRINTLAEKEKLAKFLMQRLEVLKAKEAKTGEMQAETRETVTALTTVLDKIRLEADGTVQDPDALKKELFGDWARKVQEENKESEES
jgi:Txe/YoeB family toxin of Txe-Axe toxin-antitoxin module